jgi:hypothetical protein
MSQSSFLCCRNTVKATDCIPPIVAIHAVRDSSAGYLFTDVACHFSTKMSIVSHKGLHTFPYMETLFCSTAQ